jgi:membrane protein YqaA with SNARE-associated domain
MKKLSLRKLESWFDHLEIYKKRLKMKKQINHKRNEIILIGFLVIVLVIALIFIIKFSEFKEIFEGYVSTYGFLGIIALSFLLEFFWQPFGPEGPIVFGILFGLNPFLVFSFTVIGSYLASFLNYFIGKKYLSRELISSMIGKKSIKYEKYFNKYGKWAIFLAAIGPIPWIPFCWLAGSFKMKFKRFFFWGLFPRLFRILIVVLLISYLNGLLF